jgi:hypothetical protein
LKEEVKCQIIPRAIWHKGLLISSYLYKWA